MLSSSLDRELKEWLDLILGIQDYFALCQFAYDNRKCDSMRKLAEKAQGEEGRIGPQVGRPLLQ